MKFLTSGTLIFYNLANISNGIDVFLVGGAGGWLSEAQGGTDGGKGTSHTQYSGTASGGTGQETTTREFAEELAELYSGGGGGGSGGSGIVIIRNAR